MHAIWLRAVLATAALIAAPGFAADAYPTKPIRILAGGAAGGPIDIMARVVGQKLSEQLGQSIVIDNRGGAGGTIATRIAAQGAPDGYTLLCNSSQYVVAPSLYSDPGYDPFKDFAPIINAGVSPNILFAHLSVAAKNLQELIALGKTRKFSYGSSGTGSTPHLTAELFQQMSRTEMVHVPYKGDGPAIGDLIAGQIQVLFATGLVLTPHINAGRLRGLAVTTEKRSPANSDLPAIGELVPGYAVDGWTGIWAPAGTPKEIVSKLNQALARILKQPDVQERLRAGGAEPTPCTPVEFARLIARDIAKWSRVVKAGNIKID